MHRPPRRKLVWQHAPRAAGAAEIEDAVDHLTHVHRSVASTRLGRWNQRLDDRPLFVRQVRWVGRPCHIQRIGLTGPSHTLSKRPQQADTTTVAGNCSCFRRIYDDTTKTAVNIGIEEYPIAKRKMNQRDDCRLFSSKVSLTCRSHSSRRSARRRAAAMRFRSIALAAESGCCISRPRSSLGIDISMQRHPGYSCCVALLYPRSS